VNDIRHDDTTKRPSVTSHAAAEAVQHIVVSVADSDTNPNSDVSTAVDSNIAAIIQST
jgi:hypothetical protein